MSPVTEQIALQVIMNLVATSSDLMRAYTVAKQEDRELNDEEMDRFVSADNTARSNLQTAIDRIKAQKPAGQ